MDIKDKMANKSQEAKPANVRLAQKKRRISLAEAVMIALVVLQIALQIAASFLVTEQYSGGRACQYSFSLGHATKDRI